MLCLFFLLATSCLDFICCSLPRMQCQGEPLYGQEDLFVQKCMNILFWLVVADTEILTAKPGARHTLQVFGWESSSCACLHFALGFSLIPLHATKGILTSFSCFPHTGELVLQAFSSGHLWTEVSRLCCLIWGECSCWLSTSNIYCVFSIVLVFCSAVESPSLRGPSLSPP